MNMIEANTYAELEDHDDSENCPDGVLADLLERLFKEDDEGHEGQGEPHLRGEKDLARIGPAHLVQLGRNILQAEQEVGDSVGEYTEAPAFDSIVSAVRAVQAQLGVALPKEQSLLAPLGETVPKRPDFRCHFCNS